MKAKILTLLLFLALSVALAPLRMIHCFDAYTLLGFISTFTLTAVLIHKTKTRLCVILCFALLGFCLISAVVHIIYFNDTLGSLYGNIICVLAIFLGYLYTKITTLSSRVIYLIVCLAFCIFASTCLKQLWVENVWMALH